MEKEEWKDGEKEGDPRPDGEDRRVGGREQGQRPVDAPQEGHHGRAVPGVLQGHQPRPREPAHLEPQPRGRQHRVHAAALHPRQGAVRPVEPRQEGRREALCEARLHHGRRRGAHAHLPALREGRDRLGRPAAQREPRAAAGKPRRARHPRRLHQARALHARGPGQARQACRGRGRRRRDRRGERGGQGQGGQVHAVLCRVRRGAQGRPGRGLRQPRAHRQVAALRFQHDRQRDRLAGRLQGPHEGGARRPSTTSPPTPWPPRRTARSSRSSRRRASRCC